MVGYVLRPWQETAIREVIEGFKGGARTVFLDAPVGSGKGLVNLLVAKELGGAYITTPQVLLVDQYTKDTAAGAKFDNMAATLYGRRNYPCEQLRSLPKKKGGDKTATADGAPCTLLDGWPGKCPKFQKGKCSYYNARGLAQGHPRTVTTFAYLLQGVRHGLEDPESDWKPRPLMVIDEAHGLADDLVQFYTVELGPHTLREFDFDKYDSPTDPRFPLLISLEYYARRRSASLRVYQTIAAPTVKEQDEMRHLTVSVERAYRIIHLLEDRQVTWVHSFDLQRHQHTWRPLLAKFVKLFWERFSHLLLSSATFFNVSGLVKDACLPEPWAVVTVKDSFDASKAPILPLSVARIDQRITPEDRQKVIDAAVRIVADHPGQRGIVHANSYDLASWLRDGLPTEVGRRLVFHDRFDRKEGFEAWKSNEIKDSVFVAVSMHEGLDLVGDLARWQIIMKVPFPNLRDPWDAAASRGTGRE